jgi:hypothetical protein
VRRHLAGLTVNAARLGAVAVQVEGVRIFLRDTDIGDGRVRVTAATVVPRPGKMTEVGDG